ncbi:hypothetical protein KFL_000500270 [Klebsormidium nitens]|uniref:Splicing factor Cactin n=1 Tax=Klebsormidium nitens TaxID=105231 RepID=A0A1Y1HNQ4_KLENI|nr:hypothetical protein KFL_000500270 [Klebsormidium nitens]|eukprot:GAQ80274.1 hypothetical protein KFL_000500270 [Klebsormidium nitens]
MARDDEGRRDRSRREYESDGEEDTRAVSRKDRSSKRDRSERRTDQDKSREQGRRKDEGRRERAASSDDERERGRRKTKGSSQRKRSGGSRRRSDDESEATTEDESNDSERDQRRRPKSSKRRKRRREEESSDDSEEERKARRARKRRDRESEEESEDSEGGGGRRKVTQEEIEVYLKKKAEKKAKKLAAKMKTSTVAGYTDESNPFGDANLTERFVWRKKIEKHIAAGEDPKDLLSVKAEKRRIAERMAEIEKVKKRREEREKEKAQREEEQALLARERARAEFDDFEKKEEEFQFEMSKARAEIRLREGRAKPIDILAKNLKLSDDFDVEIDEPYTVFQGLAVSDMEELQKEIRMYQELDRDPVLHADFWDAMMVICEYEIAEGKRRDALELARVRGEDPPPEYAIEDAGLHASVDADVKSMLTGKNHEELAKMEAQIQEKMAQGTAKVVEYWEAVLKRLKVFKAQARLRHIHAQLLKEHLARLQAPTREEREGARAVLAGTAPPVEREETPEDDIYREDPVSYSPEPEPEAEQTEGAQAAKEPPPAEELIEYDGALSPEPYRPGADEVVVDAEADQLEQDRKRLIVLQRERRKAQAANAAPSQQDDDERTLTAEERALANRAMGADPGDVAFGGEVNLESQVYWWHDKYRPRKPKYFNRVHTGYEWNKYNQTHYDHDNPPPKVVQGYKFNIFYPDLIDKTKAPSFVIEEDPTSKNGETCMLRFHAGPPYEDIAFRIVNKEWEYSHKKGFKSIFERGILHLYFNFIRHRYRR